MGQVMSARMDFVPEQYVDLFSTLEDAVPQMPFDDAKMIAVKALRKEKNLSFDDVFERMDPVAIGCASIGQCHYAVLKDSWAGKDKSKGRRKAVAVKIMHPDAKNQFKMDFKVFKWLTRLGKNYIRRRCACWHIIVIVL